MVYPVAAFARLDDLFGHAASLKPIPQSAPRIAWIPQDMALREQVQRWYDACWMLAAWQMHARVVSQMKHAGKSHQVYIRNIRWQQHTYLGY